MAQLEWSYAAGYLDPVHYFRTVTNSTTGTIPIATGNYPPGYKVSDGTTVGGVFPTGSSNGTLPIRVQPTINAPTLPTNSGIILFYSAFKCEIKNTSTRTGSISMGLGVAEPSQQSQPMYPYLGVMHDQDPLLGNMNPISVLGNTTLPYFGHRLDLVDQAFVSTIPNYPNWVETPDPVSLLYPAITLTYNNSGLQDLQVGGVHIIGFAIAY